MDVIHSAKSIVGHAMRPLHAGTEKILSFDGRLSPRHPAGLSVHSSVFEENGAIPRKYSSEGENISPPLSWSQAPQGTRELLLFCEDPDAPKSEPFIHWILSGLPGNLMGLPEAVPMTPVIPSLGNARQSKNSGDKIGYMGPMPPIGHGIHHYYFELFALDGPTGLEGDFGREDVVEAMSSHVLAVGTLIGTYERT